ncbi:glycoside hydrolase family 19 protein [Neorhizobium galegae]|nr:glycoside hydrolase family 19 protein [Neorhizobium galegae]
MHESGGLIHDREVWGPTAAQQRYEGRKDLGNTRKGDGSKFRGYGPIQITGRGNTTGLYQWCQKRGLNPPDFVDKPELMATSPWAGWSVVWYWEVGNPDRKSLNRYADTNDIEMVTRKVNGGLNGYEDRLSYYDRSALVLLDLAPNDIKGFQSSAKLKVDGVSGPQTRAEMHKRLVALTKGESSRPEVKNAPVTEETTVEVEKPTVPKKVETEVRQKTNWISRIFGGLFSGGGLAAWFAGMDRDAVILVGCIGVVVIVVVLFGGEWIIRRVKSIRKEVEA